MKGYLEVEPGHFVLDPTVEHPDRNPEGKSVGHLLHELDHKQRTIKDLGDNCPYMTPSDYPPDTSYIIGPGQMGYFIAIEEGLQALRDIVWDFAKAESTMTREDVNKAYDKANIEGIFCHGA